MSINRSDQNDSHKSTLSRSASRTQSQTTSEFEPSVAGQAPTITAPMRQQYGLQRWEESDPPSISVVIPVYMAEAILPVLLKRLSASLDALNRSYEMILVCDGSPDGSWEVMAELSKKYSRLCAVNLSRNFGQHYALTAGMDLAAGDWTVIMDCDLQDQPEEIGKLLEMAETGYDIVIARRMKRQHKWWKRFTSRLFFLTFAVLSGYRLDSADGNFRVMRRPVMDGLCNMRESYRMFAGLVEWVGFKTAYIEVQHAARYEGPSSYNLAKLLRMAMDGMISFSNRPLYVSIGLGIGMSLLSALYGIFLIVRNVFTDASILPGWLSTMTATVFIGGLVLLNQGILGIYLGRTYNQVKGRPLYVIDRVLLGRDDANTDKADYENV